MVVGILAVAGNLPVAGVDIQNTLEVFLVVYGPVPSLQIDIQLLSCAGSLSNVKRQAWKVTSSYNTNYMYTVQKVDIGLGLYFSSVHVSSILGSLFVRCRLCARPDSVSHHH